MYKVKFQNGMNGIFDSKQSCETFMIDIKRKPKETLIEHKARLDKLIHYAKNTQYSY